MRTAVLLKRNNTETRSTPFHINFPQKTPKHNVGFRMLWILLKTLTAWLQDVETCWGGPCVIPNHCAACLLCLPCIFVQNKNKQKPNTTHINVEQFVDWGEEMKAFHCEHLVVLMLSLSAMVGQSLSWHIKFNFKTAAGVEVNLGCLFDPLAPLTDL